MDQDTTFSREILLFHTGLFPTIWLICVPVWTILKCSNYIYDIDRRKWEISDNYKIKKQTYRIQKQKAR